MEYKNEINFCAFSGSIEWNFSLNNVYNKSEMNQLPKIFIIFFDLFRLHQNCIEFSICSVSHALSNLRVLHEIWIDCIHENQLDLHSGHLNILIIVLNFQRNWCSCLFVENCLCTFESVSIVLKFKIIHIKLYRFFIILWYMFNVFP